MRPHLIQNALELEPPPNYFRGRTSEDTCLPRNLILFSRKTSRELQRRSFDSYPHHRFVLIFNLMTSGVVTVDGIQWRLKAQQALLIFPYQFHYFSELEAPNVVWLILTFELEDPIVLESFRNRLIDLDQETIDQLNDLLEDYKAEPTPRANRRLMLNSALLVNGLRERLQDGPRSKLTTQSPTKRASTELINAIQGQLKRPTQPLLTIADIAAALNRSESNLRTVFRQCFNIGLGAYLKNYRAHQAILLMQNPNLSLTEIAFELGFTTLSSFSRFFSQAIGASPRAYRAQILLSNS